MRVAVVSRRAPTLLLSSRLPTFQNRNPVLVRFGCVSPPSINLVDWKIVESGVSGRSRTPSVLTRQA